MQFLSKVFFLDSTKSGIKKELYICYSAIDIMTWYKKEQIEGTILHTCLNVENAKVNHVIDGVPENVNNITFEGAFFKCTCHYVGKEGSMKSFSAWLNPENILSLYSDMPDDTKVFFRSGKTVLIVGKMQDVLKSLLEHGKKQKERKKLKYGK